jgi:hypothetical protein
MLLSETIATSGPNWAEQVTAIATVVLALGAFGAAAAAIFAARQVRETRQTRQAQMAAEFFRRWNEDALVETRRLVASFATPEDLESAFQGYVAENAPEAYVLYRELDYFEQLAVLERSGGIEFELIKSLVGRALVARWDLWRPALHAVHEEDVYPMYRELAERMRDTLAESQR